MLCLVKVALVLLGGLAVAFLGAAIYIRARRQRKHTVAFFHPYCNDGGGGERVLWRAIDALQQLDPQNNIDIVVYSGDSGVSGRDILNKAKSRFSIELRKEPIFVFLKSRTLVEAKWYPYFTMVGQSLGSVFLGLEAIFKLTPDTYIDSMGYSWTFPIFALLGGSFVASYVHYPTISTDMLSRVSNRSSTYNNDQRIASSGWKTTLKVGYYRLFAYLYGKMGRFSSFTMVNSSWTKSHIEALWSPKKLELVYPPCDTTGLKKLEIQGRRRETIVSIAQFRPEKNHFLQISIVDSLVKQHGFKDVHLSMIGSVRVGNEADIDLVERLRKEIELKGLEKNISILLSVPADELKRNFASHAIGLHTMSQEHFGIGVVEMQAAGLVPVANDSAGPKMDIIPSPAFGRLASTLDEYVDAISQLLRLQPHQFEALAVSARQNADRFSDEAFVTSIQRCFESLPSLKKHLSPK